MQPESPFDQKWPIPDGIRTMIAAGRGGYGAVVWPPPPAERHRGESVDFQDAARVKAEKKRFRKRAKLIAATTDMSMWGISRHENPATTAEWLGRTPR